MIFCEYLSPIPGRASSCSLLAEVRSTRSAAGAVAAGVLFFEAPCGAGVRAMLRPASNASANIPTRMRALRFVRFMVPPQKYLVPLGFLVASGLRFGWGHELAVLCLAVELAALVVDPAVKIDPDLAA